MLTFDRYVYKIWKLILVFFTFCNFILHKKLATPVKVKQEEEYTFSLNDSEGKAGTSSYVMLLVTVLRIRFILVSRIRFNETDPDPGSKKSVKIMENFHENQPKSLEYHTFFFQNY